MKKISLVLILLGVFVLQSRTEGSVIVGLSLDANREVYYIGEPIDLRLTFSNYEETPAFINLSPKAMATIVFQLSYEGKTSPFTSFHQGDDVFKYELLKEFGMTFVNCILTQGKPPLQGNFANLFYGELPDHPTVVMITAIYENRDAGRRSIPFWTGKLVSEPFQITIAKR